MLRILVVEDHPMLGDIFVRLLAPRAHVELARRHDEAMRRLEAASFDVVLSDVDLGPGPNGLALLATVAERWPGVRRIAMSAQDHVTSETLLLKPVGRRELDFIVGVDDLGDEAARARTASGLFVRAEATPAEDDASLQRARGRGR